LPISLLIAGVLGPPLLPAVTDHLRVQRISSDLLPMVFGASTALAFRLAANTLLKAVWGRLKSTLAIGAAAGRDQCDSSKAGKGRTSEKTRLSAYRGEADFRERNELR
jgi:hypothetical protein